MLLSMSLFILVLKNILIQINNNTAIQLYNWTIAEGRSITIVYL